VTIATAIVARTRFGSLKVTALCELDPPKEAAEIDRKIAAPLARIKTDPIMHRVTKESGSPKVRIEA
jgi:hypothetical protein